MLYVAPRPNFDIKDRDVFNRTKKQGFCAKCGEKINYFQAPFFYMDAGYGLLWKVLSSCGLCEPCFVGLKNEKETVDSSYNHEFVREIYKYECRGPDGKTRTASVISRDDFRN